MSKYFEKEQKIRFQHIDKAGIVFYPRYLEMLNELVEDFFEEVLHLPFSQMHETHGIPTVDLKIQFKSPARLGDVLQKKLAVISQGQSSCVCSFIFSNQDKVVLTGEVVLVYVAISGNRKNIAKEQFPEEVIKNLQPYLMAENQND